MKPRTFAWHPFIRAAILFGFAMFIVYLTRTDSLVYYIAPRMQIYVKYSSVVLYVIAVYQVYAGIHALWGKPVDCGCEQPRAKSPIASGVAYGLFALPLLLGFLLPNTVMSSSLADKKGMNLAPQTAAKSISRQLAAASPAPAAAGGQGVSSSAPANGAAAGAANGASGKAAGDAGSANAGSAAQSGAAAGGTSGAAGAASSSQTGSSNGAAAGGPQAGSSSGAAGAATGAPQAGNAAAGAANAAGGAVTDAQLQQMFKSPDEYSEDFAKMGMILYRKPLISVKPEIFMEILSTVSLFQENFYGKTIELSGFVYREEGLKADQLIVGRFAVSCCSADASPYGVLTEFPGASAFAKDTWIKVTGKIAKGSYDGNDIFKIKADKIEKITAPKTPYVYPNFDPLPELAK
ncbi:TIGR03943 family protein [Paenibacillus athensensis]|uniref:TIGR03943 family protein n=1 Tax=Paenibacillus athensensis TaxID=1967502 RepID=A0A4Y8Q8A5_9BACL|nr:TIGR03943 family protein [Paenibacillus athensensis]MCD1260371.1 TIGR03943 family protein [Paenibacillus athensensis]